MSTDQTDYRSRGGHARAAALSPERRQEISRKALAARWGHPEKSTAGPRRKAPPDGVKLAACLIRLGAPADVVDPALSMDERIRNALIRLGLDPAEPVEWDHNPALGIRVVREDGSDWEPPQHDPRHIVPLGKAVHKLKTEGKTGESKLSITFNGDKQRAAKVKRIRRKAATSPELERAAALADLALGEPARPKRKASWPKGRKLTSRNEFAVKREARKAARRGK